MIVHVHVVVQLLHTHMYVCMSFQVRYFEDYANEFNLNIQYDTDIKKIARDRVTKDFVLHDQNDQVYTCPVLIMGCVYCVYSCTCSCHVSEETTSRKFLITLLIELACLIIKCIHALSRLVCTLCNVANVIYFMYMYLSLFPSTGLWVPNIPDIGGAELTEVREAIIGYMCTHNTCTCM